MCAIPGIYSPFRHRSGPTFSNAVSRSLHPLGLWDVLKRVYFGFESTAPALQHKFTSCFLQTLLLATLVALGFLHSPPASPEDLPPPPTFSPFDHCKTVNSVGNKTPSQAKLRQ